MQKKQNKDEFGSRSDQDISESQDQSQQSQQSPRDSQDSEMAEDSDVSVGGSTFKLPGQDQFYGHPGQNKVQNYDSGRNV